MTVAENIKRIRKKKGLTQKQLGKKCGMAESTLRQYELGYRHPKIETIQKIANALGCSLVALTGIEEYKKTEEYKTGIRSVDAYDGVLALLKNIYGDVQEKNVQQEYGESFYYLVGKDPDAFILYEDDIKDLQNYIETSLPIVVDRLKDTRPEKDVVAEIINDLNSPEYITKIKKYIQENS